VDSQAYQGPVAFEIVVNSDPIVTINASRNATDVGFAGTFSPSVSGGTGNDTSDWTGLDQAGLTCRASPPTVGGPSVESCDPSSSGTFQVGVTATDAVGGTSPIVNATLSVATDPRVRVSATASGGVLSVDTSMSGGTPPYRYVYSGLPASCPSQDLGNLSCSDPANSGGPVSVTVTDAVGALANATAMASNPSGTATGAQLFDFELIPAGGVVVAVIAAVLVLWRRPPGPASR
jgi:hypothetical protein